MHGGVITRVLTRVDNELDNPMTGGWKVVEEIALLSHIVMYYN